MRNPARLFLGLAVLISLSPSMGILAGEEASPRVYTRWESFHKEDGLPGDKVFCVAVATNEPRLGGASMTTRPRFGNGSFCCM